MSAQIHFSHFLTSHDQTLVASTQAVKAFCYLIPNLVEGGGGGGELKDLRGGPGGQGERKPRV